MFDQAMADYSGHVFLTHGVVRFAVNANLLVLYGLFL